MDFMFQFYFVRFQVFLKEYKTIYWPLFTSIYNKVNNIQLDNILITTKLFFLASAEPVTQIPRRLSLHVRNETGQRQNMQVNNLDYNHLFTHLCQQVLITIWSGFQEPSLSHSMNHGLLVDTAQRFWRL